MISPQHSGLQAQMEFVELLKSSRAAQALRAIDQNRKVPVVEVNYRYGKTLYAQAAILDTLSGFLYDWSANTSSLVEYHARDIPQTTITKDLLPSPEGLFWFGEHGLTEGAGTGFPGTVGAYSWCLVKETVEGQYQTGIFVPVEEATGIYVVIYCWDKEDKDNIGVLPILFGVYDFDSILEDDFPFRAFAAALIFINQKVVFQRETTIPRYEQRRRKNSSIVKRHSYKTIVLRDLEHLPTENTTTSHTTEWTHRWTVRGHWRAQFYPRTGVHRPKFIYPYVKGPEDLPLVYTRPLFKVAR